MELNEKIEELRAEMRDGFGAADRRFDAMDVRFDTLEERLRSHMDMVAERLETKFQQLIDSHITLRDRLNAHERRHDATDRKLGSLDLRVTALENRGDNRQG